MRELRGPKDPKKFQKKIGILGLKKIKAWVACLHKDVPYDPEGCAHHMFHMLPCVYFAILG